MKDLNVVSDILDNILWEDLSLVDRCNSLRATRLDAITAADETPLTETHFITPFEDGDPRRSAYVSAYRQRRRELRKDQYCALW